MLVRMRTFLHVTALTGLALLAVSCGIGGESTGDCTSRDGDLLLSTPIDQSSEFHLVYPSGTETRTFDELNLSFGGGAGKVFIKATRSTFASSTDTKHLIPTDVQRVSCVPTSSFDAGTSDGGVSDAGASDAGDADAGTPFFCPDAGFTLITPGRTSDFIETIDVRTPEPRSRTVDGFYTATIRADTRLGGELEVSFEDGKRLLCKYDIRRDSSLDVGTAPKSSGGGHH